MGILAAVPGLLLVLAVGYILLLKRDLRDIRRTLEIIRDEDTNMQLTTTSNDRSVAAMTATINEILEKQKGLEREVKTANLRLRRAVTNISHDLRTPLTSAVGYLQLMQSGKTPPDKREEYLDILGPRLQVLSGLIDELFAFSQIIEGKTLAQLERVNLTVPVTEVLTGFYADFTARGEEPELHVPDAPVWALCDPAWVGRVAQNLIKNALVHGSGGFQLALEETPPAIRGSNRVSAPEDIALEHIFDRFYTADAARSGGNTGLGLAIARELTERMGGKISAALTGDVLTFTVTLPAG